MKRFVMGVVAMLALGVVGCGQQPDQAPEPAATNAAVVVPVEPTTAQTLIGGVTGKDAVDQGRKAQDKIRAIGAARDADMQTFGE